MGNQGGAWHWGVADCGFSAGVSLTSCGTGKVTAPQASSGIQANREIAVQLSLRVTRTRWEKVPEWEAFSWGLLLTGGWWCCRSPAGLRHAPVACELQTQWSGHLCVFLRQASDACMATFSLETISQSQPHSTWGKEEAVFIQGQFCATGLSYRQAKGRSVGNRSLVAINR